MNDNKETNESANKIHISTSNENISHSTITNNTIVNVGTHDKPNEPLNTDPDIQLLYNSLKGFEEEPSFFQKVKGFVFRKKVASKYRKGRYQERFDSKLDGRFEITLKVNKEAFRVNYQTNKNIDEAFKVIKESFNEKGRLLIVGSPGSGKTVLLLKLAIELLGDECKADQQLPVIFNLASWSPDYAKFDDWLIDVLNAGNGLSKDFARTLLEQNRIIFLLDGLDELARKEEPEIANAKRAKCLDSLNGYLREDRKAVICCRQEELLKMSSATGQIAPVEATVKVRDLGKDDIKLALLLAQDETKNRASANNLLQIIETNDVFLDVLATPFYFTTALEVFDKQLLDEKDFPNDADKIKKYLLDKFIESKLKHSNKLTEFEKDKAKIRHWLSWLATLMEKKELVSFELADLQFNNLRWQWSPKLLLGLLNSIYFGLYALIIYGYLFGLIVGIIGGLLTGVLIGVFVGIFFNAFFGNMISTSDIQQITFTNLFLLSKWKSALFRGLFVAIFVGLLVSIMAGLILSLNYGAIGFIVGGVIFGLSGGGFAGCLFSITTVLTEVLYFAELDKSYQRLMSGIIVDIVKWTLLVGFGSFLLLFFVQSIDYLSYNQVVLRPKQQNGFSTEDFWNILSILFFGIVAGIFATPVFRHFILRFSLFVEGSTPIKYATFLDLAAEARILEKDGGHWRFRHQTLQEHFAKSGNE